MSPDNWIRAPRCARGCTYASVMRWPAVAPCAQQRLAIELTVYYVAFEFELLQDHGNESSCSWLNTSRMDGDRGHSNSNVDDLMKSFMRSS
jgi:hypothetical protein